MMNYSIIGHVSTEICILTYHRTRRGHTIMANSDVSHSRSHGKCADNGLHTVHAMQKEAIYSVRRRRNRYQKQSEKEVKGRDQKRAFICRCLANRYFRVGPRRF